MHRSLRVVAAFEALKGLLALAAAAGLLSLLHGDLLAVATRLVEHTHLNPASHYPRIFLDAARRVQGAELLPIAVGAAVYALLRLVEAYGLLRSRAWAEVLAAVSGAIYLPFELIELLRERTMLSLVLLTLNAGVVALMVNALRRRRAGVR